MEEGAAVLFSHRICQDSLESYFGVLRRGAGPKASANKFILTHRSLNICQHYKLFKTFNLTTSRFSPIKQNYSQKLQKLTTTSEFKPLSFTEKQALYYMSGAAVRRLIMKKPHLCLLCKNALQHRVNYQQLMGSIDMTDNSNKTVPAAFYTFEREFGQLVYVKPAVFSFICNIAMLFTPLYKEYIKYPNIHSNLRSSLIDRFGKYPLLPTKCRCNLQSLLINELCQSLLSAHMKKSNLALVCK